MQIDPDLILPLSDPSAGLSQVGGKGASLARLAAAGLPVPPGFCITTAAYRRFVAENGLQEQILKAASQTTPDQPATLEEASERIARLFATYDIELPAGPGPAGSGICHYRAHPAAAGWVTQHDMPDDIAGEIRQAYAGLGEGDVPVAVRSSATAEDLPGASFAGQQETYLNIRGAEAVLVAVQKCWASLWTARAIAYRGRQGIAADSVAIAVVVQKLVFADAAGVMFTADPLTGRRDEIVINATWGLGEALAAGRFAILQARPITRLPEPALFEPPQEAPLAEPPLEWVTPYPKPLLARGSSIDLLPDAMSPLFITLGMPILTEVFRRMYAEVMGLHGEDTPTFEVIHGYVFLCFPRRGKCRGEIAV